METPFDFNTLTAKLKASGLPILEEQAESVVKAVFDWALESAAIHPNAFVKAGVPLAVATIQPLVKTVVDKIDGQEG